MERLDRREVLAGGLGSIAGTAFVDLTNNGLTPDDPRIGGAEIRLWKDGGNGVFNGAADDTLIATATSGALGGTNPGGYRFDQLVAGLYFVQQVTGQTGFLIPAPTPVTVVNDQGVLVRTIDSFDVTPLDLNANSAVPTAISVAPATEVIGGIRKAELTYGSGPSSVEMLVDTVNQRLFYSSAAGTTGTMTLRYDGTNGNIAINPTGLGGVNLDSDDAGAGMMLEVYRDVLLANQTYRVNVYSGATLISRIDRPFDPTKVGQIYKDFIPFSAFSTAAGALGGADFSSVGAIELVVANAPDQDIRITIFESLRPEVLPINLKSSGVTIGDQVFRDSNNNGIFDPPTETGIAGVPINLYRMTALTDVVNPTTQTAIATTTTNASGIYQFTGQPTGFYASVIPATAFAVGGALAGLDSSNPTPPTAGANAKIDNDDDGRVVAGQAYVITETFSIVAGQEPTGSGLVNNTIDFGFLAGADLDIDKQFVSLDPTATGNFTATFRVDVTNNGSLAATGVTVVDTIPADFTYKSIGSIGNPAVPPTSVTGVTQGPGTVTFSVNDLADGGTASFFVTFDVPAGKFGSRINTVTVDANEIDLIPANNTASAQLQLNEADLRIVKTVQTATGNPIPPATVLTGNNIVYRLAVVNDGPNTATGVTVVDTLPADVTFVSGTLNGSATGVTFDPLTRRVTATVGNMLDDATATILITATVGAGAAGSISNTATVASSPNIDPNPANNTSNVATSVTRGVDLAVNKELAAGSVSSFGGTVTYVVTVTNTTSAVGNARGFNVADVLPTGLTYVPNSFNAQGSGVTIAAAGQNLAFTGVPLNVGQSVTFRYDARIGQDAAASLTNNAVVSVFSDASGADVDQDPTDNQDAVTITPNRAINLVVTKSDGIAAGGSHAPGSPLTYSIVVTNSGTSDAINVNVTDNLPTGVTVSSIVIGGTTITDTNPDPAIVAFVIPRVPAGAANAVTVQLNTQVAATLTGTITNSVTISGGGDNDPPDGNSATETTTLVPVSDAAIVKTAPATAVPGRDTIQYTLVISNSGPSVATGVTVNDTLPAGLELQSVTLGGTPVTNTGTGNEIQFTIPTLTLGQANAQTAIVTAKVRPGAIGVITNNARVTASGDPNPNNNTSRVNTTLNPLADIGVTKTVSAADAIPGNDLTYTIVVTNAGPSTAAAVTMVDVLPTGVTFVSGTGPNNQNLSASGQRVEVAIGNVEPNASLTYTIIAKVNQGFEGDAVNSVTVATTTDEGQNVRPNTASAKTLITIPDPFTASVTGRVFDDFNNNGIYDGRDRGVPGVKVNLYSAGSMNLVQSVETDIFGMYRFTRLPGGIYDIRIVRPAGFIDGLESLGGGPPTNFGDGVIPNVRVEQESLVANNTFALIELPSKRRFLASAQ
jgi:uncharacterized repeat protein (TIGR01451 family)